MSKLDERLPKNAKEKVLMIIHQLVLYKVTFIFLALAAPKNANRIIMSKHDKILFKNATDKSW
jgi:hypothetical protein